MACLGRLGVGQGGVGVGRRKVAPPWENQGTRLDGTSGCERAVLMPRLAVRNTP